MQMKVYRAGARGAGNPSRDGAAAQLALAWAAALARSCAVHCQAHVHFSLK